MVAIINAPEVSPFEEIIDEMIVDVQNLAIGGRSMGMLSNDGDVWDIKSIKDPKLIEFLEPVKYLAMAKDLFRSRCLPQLLEYVKQCNKALKPSPYAHDPKVETYDVPNMFYQKGESPFEEKGKKAAEDLVLLATSMRKDHFFGEMVSGNSMTNVEVKKFLEPIDFIQQALTSFQKNCVPVVRKMFGGKK